jgi:hypothetical protein
MFKFVAEYLKLVQNSAVFTAQIYLIINALGGRQLFMFPRTLHRIVQMRGLELVLFRDRLCALPKRKRTNWRIFSLDIQNQHIVVYALCLPTSKAIGNYLDRFGR